MVDKDGDNVLYWVFFKGMGYMNYQFYYLLKFMIYYYRNKE